MLVNHSNSYNGKILIIADEVPHSVRTLLRAQILLTLKLFQPTSNLELVHHGFRKSTVGRVLREMNREGLIFEKYRLHRLTKTGESISEILLKDPCVAHWAAFQSYVSEWEVLDINRPKIGQIDLD